MTSDTSLSTIDARPYFERVLRYALQEGLVDPTRLEAMHREGAKGIVQLAGYFSTAHLRPELEAARTRLVNLVSLALEADSGRQMQAAARLLREKSLLALSKAGADRLRRLLALPTDSLLGDDALYREDEKRFLDRHTLDEPINFVRYLQERTLREANQKHIDLAYWLADKFGLSRDSARELHISSESLVNSVLLVLYAEESPAGLFSTSRYQTLHEAACEKRSHSFAMLDEWLQELPAALQAVLEAEKKRFLAHVLPIIRQYSAAEICASQERFAGLFFFDTYSIEEITHHDQEKAQQWQKLTGGQGAHTDVQCTVLLMVATELEPLASLRKKDALAIWENYRAYGFDDDAVLEFIDQVVPFEYQSDVKRLWLEDLGPEARIELDDDMHTALTYLQQTCRSSWKKH